MPAVGKRMPLCGVNDSYLYGLVVGTTLFLFHCVEEAVMWGANNAAVA